MYRFTNDYSEGAHPSILEAMAAANLEGNFGYGCDPHCERAAALIRQKIGRPDADVHFFVGGTQANVPASAPSCGPTRRPSRPIPATSACMRPARWRPPATNASPCPPPPAAS